MIFITSSSSYCRKPSIKIRIVTLVHDFCKKRNQNCRKPSIKIRIVTKNMKGKSPQISRDCRKPSIKIRIVTLFNVNVSVFYFVIAENHLLK